MVLHQTRNVKKMRTCPFIQKECIRDKCTHYGTEYRNTSSSLFGTLLKEFGFCYAGCKPRCVWNEEESKKVTAPDWGDDSGSVREKKIITG